jgi:hypothetical protein
MRQDIPAPRAASATGDGAVDGVGQESFGGGLRLRRVS